jgi:hypothetical protein
MKCLGLCWPLFVIVAASSCSSKSTQNSSGSPDGGTARNTGCAPGSREVHPCSDVIGGLVPLAGTSDPGWSIIPPALQKLPAGATFCGTVVSSDDAGGHSAFAVIISDLSGQNLYDFYAPLVMSLGCTVMQPDSFQNCDQVFTFNCGSGLELTINSFGASGLWTFVTLAYNSH